MKRIQVMMLALLSLGVAVPLAAQERHQDRSDEHDVRAQEQEAGQDVPPVQAHRYCVRDTGTRIRTRDTYDRCIAGYGYTREDIERTGEVNVGDALRRLDPRIQVERR